MLEMAVLASDVALSPVTPEILAARELRRGTLQLIEDIAPYRHLGIEPPPLRLLINRVHPVSSNARLVRTQRLDDRIEWLVGRQRGAMPSRSGIHPVKAIVDKLEGAQQPAQRAVHMPQQRGELKIGRAHD